MDPNLVTPSSKIYAAIRMFNASLCAPLQRMLRFKFPKRR